MLRFLKGALFRELQVVSTLLLSLVICGISAATLLIYRAVYGLVYYSSKWIRQGII